MKEVPIAKKIHELKKLGPFGAFALVFDELGCNIITHVYKKEKGIKGFTVKSKAPRATIYRKFLTLEKYGLLTFTGKGLTQKGKRFKNFRSNLVRADAIMKPGEFVLELTLSNWPKPISLKKRIQSVPITDNLDLENSETENDSNQKIQTLTDMNLLDLINIFGENRKLNPTNLKVLSVLENAGTKKEISDVVDISQATVYRRCIVLVEKGLLVNIGTVSRRFKVPRRSRDVGVFSSIIKEFTLIYLNGTFVMNIFVNSRFKTRPIEKILDLRLEKIRAKE